MNKELIAIDNTKKSSSLVLDKPTFAEPTANRVAACKALRSYGELLVLLVTAKRSEQLRQAAANLIENTSVALDYELKEEQLNALNRIIVGLGSFWVDNKKAKASKKIIPAYEKSVNDLADLLAIDFSLDAAASGYLKAYEVTAKRLKNAAINLVDAGDKYSVFERDRAVEAYVMAENAIMRAAELSKTAQKAIESLKKANIELVKVIKKQKYSTNDIKNYAKRIQELANMYQVLTK